MKDPFTSMRTQEQTSPLLPSHPPPPSVSSVFLLPTPLLGKLGKRFLKRRNPPPHPHRRSFDSPPGGGRKKKGKQGGKEMTSRMQPPPLPSFSFLLFQPRRYSDPKPPQPQPNYIPNHPCVSLRASRTTERRQRLKSLSSAFRFELRNPTICRPPPTSFRIKFSEVRWRLLLFPSVSLILNRFSEKSTGRRDEAEGSENAQGEERFELTIFPSSSSSSSPRSSLPSHRQAPKRWIQDEGSRLVRHFQRRGRRGCCS